MRGLTGRMAVGAILATLLVACSPPQSAEQTAEIEPTATPAVVDPAQLGWASADLSALAPFPQLAEPLATCAPDDAGAQVQVVTAARQVLGVRCSGGADVAVTYADVRSGEAWSARDLLTGQAQRLLEGALATAGDPDGTDAPSPDPAAGDALADVRFDQAGDLVVVAPDGTAWMVASEEVPGMLSDAGRRVRGAVRSGAGFTGAATVPTPEVVPVVTAVAASQLPPPPAPLPVVVPPSGAVDCAVAKCIALTYDDGPGSDTPRLLQILAEKDVKATFFMVGRMVERNPGTARSILDAGHELGNHTWNHPDLRTVSAATVRAEIADTSAAILAATGQNPTVFRPPYGAVNDAVKAELAAQGLPVILWNVDTEDWKTKNAAQTRTNAVAAARPGAIVLMHDIHSSTIDATPGIIDDLRAQGYTFVTVEQLLGSMTPGQSYFNRPAG